MNEEKDKNSEMYWWGITIVFLILALTFIFDFWSVKREIIEHEPVEPISYTKEPVEAARLGPTLEKAGYVYNCNDCHNNFETTGEKRELTQHTDINLTHGVVDRCFICHSKDNREALLDINKKEISFEQSEQNCYQCHGPKFREWENGTHGRMNDFWDKRKGDVRKLTCVQCHDPHSPKFSPMQPARAPYTKDYYGSGGHTHD